MREHLKGQSAITLSVTTTKPDRDKTASSRILFLQEASGFSNYTMQLVRLEGLRSIIKFAQAIEWTGVFLVNPGNTRGLLARPIRTGCCKSRRLVPSVCVSHETLVIV